MSKNILLALLSLLVMLVLSALLISSLGVPSHVTIGILKNWDTWDRFFYIVATALIIGYIVRYFLIRHNPSYRAKMEKLQDRSSQEYKDVSEYSSVAQRGYLIAVVFWSILLFLIIKTPFGEFVSESIPRIFGFFTVLIVGMLIILLRRLGDLRKRVVFGKTLMLGVVGNWLILCLFFFMTLLISLIISQGGLNGM